MTSQERRGRFLFLLLATPIIVMKLGGLVFLFTAGLAEINWLRSVLGPLAFASTVAFLWQGEVWLQWTVGSICIFSGASPVILSVRVLVQLARVTPPEATETYVGLVAVPFGLLAALGCFYLMAGLLFLFSPSMNAFFRYQREEPQETGDSG